MSGALTELLGILAFAARVLTIFLALWLAVTTAGMAYVKHAQQVRAEVRVAHCVELATELGANPEGCR